MNTWLPPGPAAPEAPANVGTSPGTSPIAGPARPAAPALDAELPPEVARLFRHSLAQGRIHPLMHQLLRYRRETAP